MSDMFKHCEALEALNLASFDTRRVISMPGIFSECSALKTLGLSSFDIYQVRDMTWMFEGCRSLVEVKCDFSWEHYRR